MASVLIMLSRAKARSLIVVYTSSRCKQLSFISVFLRRLSGPAATNDQCTASPNDEIWRKLDTAEHYGPPSSYSTDRVDPIPTRDPLKLEIIKLCSGPDISELHFHSLLKKRLQHWTGVEISVLMLHLGKKSKEAHHTLLKKYLHTIASHLVTLSPFKWNTADVASIFYGLQCLKEGDRGYLQIVAFMTKVAAENVSNNNVFKNSAVPQILLGLQKNCFTERASTAVIPVLCSIIRMSEKPYDALCVANSLYGLQGMKSDRPEVRELLLELANKVHSCSEILSAQMVANSLYGLKGMKSDSTEVISLLSALTPKLIDCREHFYSQEVGNSLYGLQGMRSDIPEVRDVLRALELRLRYCEQHFKPQEIGNSLYGLQSMTDDCPEVRDILRGLIPRIKHCPNAMSVLELSNSFYGLHSMRSNSPEVLGVLVELTVKVRTCESNDISGRYLSNSLYGLRRMSSSDPVVRDLLAALLPKMSNCTLKLGTQEVANSLYGLQMMRSEHAEVRAVVLAMVAQVNTCKSILRNAEIGMSLYGFKGLRSEHYEVEALLKALMSKMMDCNDRFHPQNVSNALLGLQGMRCNSAQVRKVVSFLAAKIERCKGYFNDQEVCNALSGLRRMTSNYEEVRHVLAALVPHIQQCRTPLTAQGASSALYGMQGMSSDCPETLLVLSALLPLMRDFQGDMDAIGFGNALIGLQGMASDAPEVRSILAVLIPRLATVDVGDPNPIACALYGMQGMTGNCQEVRDLLSLMSHKMKLCKGVFNAELLGMALYGLQNLGGEVETAVLLERIFGHLEELSRSSGVFESLRLPDLITLAQNLVLILPEVKPALKGKAVKWKGITKCVMAEIVLRRDVETPSSGNQTMMSPGEKTVYLAALKVLANTDFTVTCNQNLLGIFEADIVLQMKQKNSKTVTIINIEVDGYTHESQRSKRFAGLRDKQLALKGVRVERIASADVKHMSTKDLDEWILLKAFPNPTPSPAPTLP